MHWMMSMRWRSAGWCQYIRLHHIQPSAPQIDRSLDGDQRGSTCWKFQLERWSEAQVENKFVAILMDWRVESWNLIISIIQCACWYVDPGKGSEESLLISWKKWSVICVEKISSVWGKCTLLHLKESGHGPQILVNSLKLCLQGCIPENRQDWG